MAKFEAVRDRLGGSEHWHVNTLYPVCHYSKSQSLRRETHDAQSRILKLRSPSLLTDCHPDLERRLCGEIVEAQRGDKADHSLGNTLRRLYQTMVLGNLGFFCHIN